MATFGVRHSSLTDITIPELVGIPSKRKSLGQLKGALYRQVDVIEQDCHLADPNGNGTDVRCNQPMLDILKNGISNLERAFKKWNLRLDQLMEEDTNETNIEEYDIKWDTVSTKYSKTKALIIVTLSNIKKPERSDRQSNDLDSSIGEEKNVFKPISELKPFQLEKMSTPGRFNEWKRRFESFFLASNLQKAAVVTQQAYFRQCISPQLANLLDSHISDDLSVYPDPDIEGNQSCIGLLQMEIEKRHPLTLRRLELFSTKQDVNMTFSDYVALVKKKSETADVSNFDADNILAYILLSGCNDQSILEEILKLSKDPDFELIVKIGTNLEVSRHILTELPGHSQHNEKEQRCLKIDTKENQMFKRNRLEELKSRGICRRCGSKETRNHKCPVRHDSVCFSCSKTGHYSKVCFASKINEENEYDHSQSEESYQESDSNPEEDSQDSGEDDLE